MMPWCGPAAFSPIEFFKTAADQYVSLEVNMRPPGGFTTDMFNYACDIDIYSRKHNQRYVYSHEDILSHYGAFMAQIESVPGVFNSALGDIGYIFRSKSLDEILKIVRFIHQTEDAAG
jgi:hypothetical protein